MNPHLSLLLSRVFSGALAPEHLDDLRKSGLTLATITTAALRSVPPAMIDELLGFKTSAVTSAYVIPYPDPRGGWMNHVCG